MASLRAAREADHYCPRRNLNTSATGIYLAEMWPWMLRRREAGGMRGNVLSEQLVTVQIETCIRRCCIQKPWEEARGRAEDPRRKRGPPARGGAAESASKHARIDPVDATADAMAKW